MEWVHKLRQKLALKDGEALELRPGMNIFGAKKIRLGIRVRRNGVWQDMPDEISDVNGAPQ